MEILCAVIPKTLPPPAAIAPAAAAAAASQNSLAAVAYSPPYQLHRAYKFNGAAYLPPSLLCFQHRQLPNNKLVFSVESQICIVKVLQDEAGGGGLF